jgi:acyl carrier protein
MEEKIKIIMSDLFGYPVEMINEETTRQDINSWDSLRHVQLILELEATFGVKFKPSEIPEMISFKKIKEYIISSKHH